MITHTILFTSLAIAWCLGAPLWLCITIFALACGAHAFLTIWTPLSAEPDWWDGWDDWDELEGGTYTRESGELTDAELDAMYRTGEDIDSLARAAGQSRERVAMRLVSFGTELRGREGGE